VEIGRVDGATQSDLDLALTAETAAVLVFIGEQYDRGAIPLAGIVKAAHARGIPVVVDAAAGVPPIATLWRVTGDAGADLVIFSGGKGLRGPQTTGFVVGRRDLIAACVANSSPRHAIGRPMKVGKEELLGLLAAVEWSLAQDEATVLEAFERRVATWIAGLRDLPGIDVVRGVPTHVAEPIPRALVRIHGASREERDGLIAAIRARGVAVGYDGEASLALNPQTVDDDEVEAVLTAVRATLLSRGAEATSI
jgi:seryl-tRNA(Sec) selenium transferase